MDTYGTPNINTHNRTTQPDELCRLIVDSAGFTYILDRLEPRASQ